MKKEVKWMNLSLLCITISSLSLICVTFADFGGNGFQRFSAYFTGVVFWTLLIAGYILLLMVSKRRKADQNAGITNKRPGIICFFTAKEAKIADIAMLAVGALYLIVLFIPGTGSVVRIILIALLVLLIQMHCVLNGVNYRYIRSLDKGKQERRRV